jgi:hypothetical protein
VLRSGRFDFQAYLDRWEQRWPDTRIHGTTKRQVAAMFAEEKAALLPLPPRFLWTIFRNPTFLSNKG